VPLLSTVVRRLQPLLSNVKGQFYRPFDRPAGIMAGVCIEAERFRKLNQRGRITNSGSGGDGPVSAAVTGSEPFWPKR
jgi:hypothetical protein